MSNQSRKPGPERTSRRGFLAASAGTVSAGAVAATLNLATASRTCHAQEAKGGDERAHGVPVGCLDYGLSFICNPSPVNSVRFWVESRTTVIDDSTGVSTEFYQCASCKSEHTFAKDNLFHEDNYDFLPILGGKDAEDLLIFRRHARLSGQYRTIVKSENVWGKPILKLREGQPVRVLETWEAIRDATASGVPLVSRTEIAQSRHEAASDHRVSRQDHEHQHREEDVSNGHGPDRLGGSLAPSRAIDRQSEFGVYSLQLAALRGLRRRAAHRRNGGRKGTLQDPPLLQSDQPSGEEPAVRGRRITGRGNRSWGTVPFFGQ